VEIDFEFSAYDHQAIDERGLKGVTVSILPPMLCNGFRDEADSIVPEMALGVVIELVVAGLWLLPSRRRLGASLTFEWVWH